LEIGRAEARRYGVEIRKDRVVKIVRARSGFSVRCKSGFAASARWIVLATGIEDLVPEMPGFRRMFGKSVHHCPFCDGWEHRDERLAVFAPDGHGASLCVRLLSWSARVTLLTHGWTGYRRKTLSELRRLGVNVLTIPVAALEGNGAWLRRVRFADGSAVDCDALFLSTGFRTNCELASDLGCRVSKKGIVLTDGRARAGPKRIYVVGDASRDSQLLVVAVAEGAKAALAIQADRERLRAKRR
jgi:thioredoxin reductase